MGSCVSSCNDTSRKDCLTSNANRTRDGESVRDLVEQRRGGD